MTNWAIDANIIVQQGVRRLLGACIEYTGGRIFVPERALALACAHHRPMARRRAKRITKWNIRNRLESYAGAQRIEIVAARTVAIDRAFAQWANAETLRNDGLWTLAPATDESSYIVERLFGAGVAREGSDTRIEEDASVAAQALDAGCRWIASHNLDMLQGEAFRRWLVHEHEQGRLLTARSPFVCSIDDAIDQMLDITREPSFGQEILAGLAWEVTRPNDAEAARDTNARLRTLDRFTDALDRGGAVRSAALVNDILENTEPERIGAVLERHALQGAIERTRTAEHRHALASRTAVEADAMPSRKHRSTTRTNTPDAPNRHC